MKIVSGPASIDLGLRISSLLNFQVIPMEYKRFPDGECYIRFTENIKDEDIIIVQTTGPPQDENLLHLLFLIDTAWNLGASSVIAVVPYVAYGRQEVRYRPGEAVSSSTVFKLIKDLGVNHFITVDFHNPEPLYSFGNHFENISAIPSLARYLNKYDLSGAFSLAPDRGAVKFVKITSKILKGDYGWLEKTRDKHTGEVTFNSKKWDIRGKDAVIFDDIISTGSTMSHAVKTLRKQGARRIYVACVHPLLLGESRKRILQDGALEIIGTDSVKSPISFVSIAPLIVEALKRWQR